MEKRTHNGLCQNPDRLPKALGVDESRWHKRDKYRPSYNVGPGRFQPVLLKAKHGVADTASIEDCKELRCMTWGLVPSWTKEKAGFSSLLKTINARADNLTASPLYRRLLGRRRCVVPVSGFFEWLKKGKDRIPYFMFRKDAVPDASPEEREPLYFAGLFDVWYPKHGEESPVKREERTARTNADEDAARPIDLDGTEDTDTMDHVSELDETEVPPDPGESANDATASVEPEFSYTIITVDVSSELSWLHDRMPAILQSQDEVNQWLDVSLPFDKVARLLRPAEGFLQWYQVPLDVNRVQNDLPTNIRPVRAAEKITSFFKPQKKASQDLESAAAASAKRRHPDATESVKQEDADVSVVDAPRKQPRLDVSAPQLQELVAMGFDETRAELALQMFDGSVEKATNYLLDRS